MARADLSRITTPTGAATDAAAIRRGPYRIIHCLRAPVGGVFRHVCDLAEAQTSAGHSVGIICDSATGGPLTERQLARIAPSLALGIQRFPMEREIAPSDIRLTARLTGVIRSLNPDILHAHGSKGGAYGRMVGTILRASGSSVARIYTPHGGSLHFDRQSGRGRVYLALERVLAKLTDGFVFVSRYEADTFAAKVGRTRAPQVVALNGLKPEEFAPVQRASDARDFLFIGELRDLKGPDVFIEALALLRGRTGRAPTAFIVGDGPDKARYQALTAQLGLETAVTFLEPLPAPTAFRLARMVVVPSRAESLPYVVLEAAAAGIPVIATRVGGIPEIFGARENRLVPPGDATALANAMGEAYASPVQAVREAMQLREEMRPRFAISAMAGAIEDLYGLVSAR